MLNFTDLVQIWLVGRASTPRLRLGVLAFHLVKFALELHSVILHRLLCNVDSWGGQVHLGSASVYLPPNSSTLHWSCTRWTIVDSTAMLTRREDKYTSAPPRCTCLPTCQHCTEVALGGAQVHWGQVHCSPITRGPKNCKKGTQFLAKGDPFGCKRGPKIRIFQNCSQRANMLK